MPSLFWIAATTALMASQSVASPVEAPVIPRLGLPAINHTLPVVRRSYTPDILGTLEAPFHKYGALMPEHRLLAREEKRDVEGVTGSVEANPTPVDVEYIIPMVIQNQTFNMLIDTGSADTWVFSDLLPPAQQVGHSVFNTSQAQQMPGRSFSLTYGDGSAASGLVYRSPVEIGDVTVTNCAVEAASSLSAGFLGASGLDGLIGLAFPKLNTVSPKRVVNFFQRAKKHLTMPLFAIALKHQEPGTLDIGFIDSSKYQGALTYIDTIKYANGQQIYWEFTTDTYSIGDTATTVAPFNAIIDTGTTLMYVPQPIVTALYSQIPGSAWDVTWGAYVFPCAADIPDLSIYVNGVPQTVPAENINWEQLNATACMGGVQPNTGMPFSILGAVFLKDLYVVFEKQQGHVPQLAFAQQA